jgi:SAM-dependent methyltransferase
MATLALRRPCPACGGDGESIPRYREVELDRCRECGLVFLGLPESADLRARYAGSEYVNSQDDYLSQDLAFRHIARQRIRWLSKRRSAGSLLELGPGRGYLLQEARSAGFEPTGVEPSPQLAERIAGDFGIAVECGFLDEVELPRSHFDVICMYHVLEHVETPVATLERLEELLADGGLMVIEVPNFACAMAQRRGPEWGAVQLRDLHVSQFTPATLTEVIRRAGLEVEAVDTVAPLHYLPPRRRLHPRALAGLAFRATRLRTLRGTHPSGYDNLRVVASAPSRG